MPKLLIFDAFTLLIREKNVAIYALLRCKIFSLKIWVCKIFDKFHVWLTHHVRMTQSRLLLTKVNTIITFEIMANSFYFLDKMKIK